MDDEGVDDEGEDVEGEDAEGEGGSMSRLSIFFSFFPMGVFREILLKFWILKGNLQKANSELSWFDEMELEFDFFKLEKI